MHPTSHLPTPLCPFAAHASPWALRWHAGAVPEDRLTDDPSRSNVGASERRRVKRQSVFFQLHGFSSISFSLFSFLFFPSVSGYRLRTIPARNEPYCSPSP